MDVGKRIKQLREDRGVSRDALAMTSGVAATSIYRIETGRRPTPTSVTLEKLAHGLGVSVGDFFEEPEQAGKEVASSACDAEVNEALADKSEALAGNFEHFISQVREAREKRLAKRLKQAESADDTCQALEELLWTRNALLGMVLNANEVMPGTLTPSIIEDLDAMYDIVEAHPDGPIQRRMRNDQAVAEIMQERMYGDGPESLLREPGRIETRGLE